MMHILRKYRQENNMSRKENEKQTEKRENEKFNSITNKSKVENQNQAHNVVQEGIGPINQRK